MSLIMDVLIKAKHEAKKGKSAGETAKAGLTETGIPKKQDGTYQIATNWDAIMFDSISPPSIYDRPVIFDKPVTEFPVIFEKTIGDPLPAGVELPKQRAWLVVSLLITAGMILVLWLASHWFVSSWMVSSKAVPAKTEVAKRQEEIPSAVEKAQIPTPARAQRKVVTKDAAWPGDPVLWNGHALEGILLDDKSPICLIDGQILRVGEVWKGKKLVSIHESNVLFQDVRGKVFKIVKRV
ncbi:MAG: hypothetical protein PHN49_00495 [Candidatus Omnitrophica bacterium]|nr:hypothetical protein [Candidatus Omnitrophota bacterium]MDD5670100.1 hypothetical protein [Candidatus Omnitrophota bacterium]